MRVWATQPKMADAQGGIGDQPVPGNKAGGVGVWQAS